MAKVWAVWVVVIAMVMSKARVVVVGMIVVVVMVVAMVVLVVVVIVLGHLLAWHVSKEKDASPHPCLNTVAITMAVESRKQPRFKSRGRCEQHNAMHNNSIKQACQR